MLFALPGGLLSGNPVPDVRLADRVVLRSGAGDFYSCSNVLISSITYLRICGLHLFLALQSVSQ